MAYDIICLFKELPLYSIGGDRCNSRMRNILITMFHGGLWHGAGWTFIFWGVLHGIFICINHLWRKTKIQLPKFANWLLTFNAVNLAWIFFRANSFENAMNIVKAMFDVNRFVVPFNKHLVKFLEMSSIELTVLSFSDWLNIIIALLVSLIVIKKDKIENYNPVIVACITSMIFVYSVINFNQKSEFLYFQF